MNSAVKLQMAQQSWTSVTELLGYLFENWPFDESDPTPNSRCLTTGDVPLHFVAGWNDVRGIELLVSAGAKIDAIGDMGYTPLAQAVCSGSVDAARRLLTLGASSDIKSEFGKSALESAISDGSEEMRNVFSGKPI